MNMQIREKLSILSVRFALATCICFSVACKKEQPVIEQPVVPSSASRTELTIDSLYYYAKQVYFWNDIIPDYKTFNPRQYLGKTDVLTSYEDELYALTQLQIDPSTGRPYEYYGDGYPKYSYISDLTLANPSFTASTKKADVDLAGNGFDIGIRPVFYKATDEASSTYVLFITAVYPGSPAAEAGIKRGFVIETVNGMKVGSNYDAEKDQVSNALKTSTVVLTGVNFMDNAPFNVTLVKKSYKSSSIYSNKVISRSGKKIGYLSFGRFAEISDVRANTDADLEAAFATFNSQGITDLVVDLRYNGGGYINTAAYLADLIAPSSVNGKKMFTEIFNQTMQHGEADILANQPLLDEDGKIQYQNGKIYTYANLDYKQDAADNNFYFSKKGGLTTVNNIVFIVSQYTASASELLINSLKPYMNVKLVGNVTFGKPIGFFPIVLENRYEVYMSMFETRNGQNEGGYFSGMRPDVLSEFDDPRYDFGDEDENYVSLALAALAPVSAVSKKAATMNIRGRDVNTKTFRAAQSMPVNPDSEFMGMIDRRSKPSK